MAEWLGRGLQNLVHRFESGCCLLEHPLPIAEVKVEVEVDIEIRKEVENQISALLSNISLSFHLYFYLIYR